MTRATSSSDGSGAARAAEGLRRPAREGAGPVLNVVLVRPEIPPNTGSVARLCAATGARLHLVGPLGFTIDDKHLRRAGLDYWPHVDACVHPDWKDFAAACAEDRFLYFSARASQSFLKAGYRRGDWLVFGGESRGLPPEVLRANAARSYAIPILGKHVRSLNLASAVSVVVYEALREIGAIT